MGRVKYHSIDGERVSSHIYVFLRSARAAGRAFEINEGHRTYARQAWFYNCWLTKRCNNGNLAARPSRNAPHIRTGRQDHAIDSDELTTLIDYGRQVGVTINRTVAGEPWHGEFNAAQLARFYKKHKFPREESILDKYERKHVSKLFYHRKKLRQHKKGRMHKIHLRWARWHKAQLTVRANLLLRLGRRDGWKKNNRGARQKLLRDIIEDGKRIR